MSDVKSFDPTSVTSRTEFESEAVTTAEELYNGPDGSTLPEELQRASKDDTTCKFCGVSYLVFSEVRALQRRTEDAEANMMLWKDKIQTVRALEAEVQALTQRLRDSEASLNAQEATNNAAIREMEGQHTEALAALASTHLTQLTSLRAENRRLVNKVRDSGRVCRSALNSLSSFRLILATTKEIISEHNPSVLAESWIAEAEAFEQSRAKTTSNLASLQSNLAESQDKIAKLKPFKAEAEALRKQLRAVEDKNSTLSLAIEELRSQGLETQLQQLRDTASSLQAQLQSEQSRKVEVESSLAKLQLSEVVSSAKITALEGQLASEQQRYAVVSSQLLAAEQLTAEQKAAMASLESELRSAQQLVSSQASELTQTQQLAVEYTALVTALQAQLASAEHHSGSQASEALQLRQIVQDSQATMASLQAQVSSLQGQIAGEQQRFASQAAELAQLRQVTLDAKTMVDTQVRISENLDAELARVKEQAKRQIGELQAQLKALSAQSEEQLHASGASSKALEAHLIDAMTKLQKKDQEIAYLQAMVHQECTERTFLLDHLNALRREHSLPQMAPGDVTRLAQEFDSKQQPVVTVPDTPTRFPPIGRPSSSTSSASHRRPSVAGGEGTGDEPPVPDEGSEGEEGIASAWVNAGRGRGAGRGKQRSIRGKAHF